MKTGILLITLTAFLLLLPSAYAYVSSGYVYDSYYHGYYYPSNNFYYTCKNFPCTYGSYYYPTYTYTNYPTYTSTNTYTNSFNTYTNSFNVYNQPAPVYVSSAQVNPCVTGVTVSVSPSSLWPAQTIYISGRAYSGSMQMVYLYLDGNYFGSVSTDSAGYFTYTYTLPGSISSGTHTIRADSALTSCGSNSGSASFNVYTGATQVCTAGEIRNRWCESSTATRYEVCQDGNHWTTVVSACPADTTCQNGYCGYQYYHDNYPYYYGYNYYNSYYYGYGNLIVSVKDCSNGNLIPTTVSINPGYPGNYGKYSSTGVVSFNSIPCSYYTITASSDDYNTETTSASVYSYQTTTSNICLNRKEPEGNHCLRVEKFDSETLVAGEAVKVKVSVSNCGTIDENNVKARLKIFDKTSLLTIPTLEVGDEKTLTFDVDVPSDATGEEKSSVQVWSDHFSVLAKKSFVISFGIPQVLLKDSYTVNRCDINQFSFEIYNLGKAKETFKISVEGDAVKWIYLTPDEVTVEAKDKAAIDAYASVPCGTDVGEYSFTITAQGSPKSSATSSLKVVDKKGVTGLIIFPVLNEQWAWLLFLLVLVILAILIIWFISKYPGKMKFRSQKPERFKPCC